jgi:RES domain-containing protein
VSYTAVVYRACGYETPLWSFPNISEARWNRPGTWPAQYLSLHPMTPWAEMLRNLHLQTPDEARDLRLPVWAIRVSLDDDPLQIDFSTVGNYGLSPEDLVADDRSACQALAEEFVRSGQTSIVVPSAALPGTRNLVMFDPAVVVDYHVVPVAPEDRPTAMTSQHGRCPEDLWESVHYQGSGAIHAELEAHLDGDDFEFIQPLVTTSGLASV